MCRIFTNPDKGKESYHFDDEKIEKFFELSPAEQRRDFFCVPFLSKSCKTVIQLENSENFASLERTSVKIAYGNKSFFRKRTFGAKFSYNKKSKRFFSTYSREDLLEDLCAIPKFEWLNDAVDEYMFDSRFLSNSVVRDILMGKLTSAEAAVKQYMKSLHIKDVDWQAYVRFMQYWRIPVNWLQATTTDVNEAMSLLISADAERMELFHSMIKEALALEKRIDPNWSIQRMREEHTMMMHELMHNDINSKEQTLMCNIA